MFFINTLAVVLSISTGLLLLFYLVRVIRLLRRVVASLSNIRLLMLTAAAQTEPVDGYVEAIASNVTILDRSVGDLSQAVGVPQGGPR